MAHWSRRVLILGACSTVGVTLFAGTASAAPATPAHPPVVVVSGLNNPRQLALADGQVLLVAEAGKGGTVATFTTGEGTDGLGYTGSVAAVWDPARAHGQRPHRIITGLLSGAAATASVNGPIGSQAVGPDGVAISPWGQVSVIETFFGPATPTAAKAREGHLLLASLLHGLRPLADISGFEAAHDPDGMGVDSDPYAVISYGDGWLVADAAGNDLLRVDPHGRISVFHVFANVTSGQCAGQADPPGFPGCNFVPTSMVMDAAGDVWVGGLSSLTPGAAQIVKLDRRGHVLSTWDGFSAVTGLAVGRDGSVYASQLFAPGSDPGSIFPGVVTKIHNGRRTSVDVPFPAGLAADRDGNVYVSAYSVMPDSGAGVPGLDTSGQVWRLRF